MITKIERVYSGYVKETEEIIAEAKKRGYEIEKEGGSVFIIKGGDDCYTFNIDMQEYHNTDGIRTEFIDSHDCTYNYILVEEPMYGFLDWWIDDIREEKKHDLVKLSSIIVEGCDDNDIIDFLLSIPEERESIVIKIMKRLYGFSEEIIHDYINIVTIVWIDN